MAIASALNIKSSLLLDDDLADDRASPIAKIVSHATKLSDQDLDSAAREMEVLAPRSRWSRSDE